MIILYDHLAKKCKDVPVESSYMNLLGICFSVRKKKDIKQVIEDFFLSDKQNLIVTVNPEMLLLSRKDPVFKKVLCSSDLVVADGIGVVYLSKICSGTPIPERVTGNDILTFFFEIAEQYQKKLFFLGGEGDLAKRAAMVVEEKYPHSKIQAENGGKIVKQTDGSWSLDPVVIHQIQAFAPDALAVALNYGRQEIFLQEILPTFPSVKVAVGIGGAFAFLTKDLKRAPVWMQKIGLEWFWRLLQEPRRIKRIFRAVFIFPILFIF